MGERGKRKTRQGKSKPNWFEVGAIIFIKQIPHAVGYDSDYEGDLSFFQADNYSSFSELTHMLESFSLATLLASLYAVLFPN